MEWTIFFYFAAFLLPRTGNLLSKRLEGADGVPLITSTFSAENNAPRFFFGVRCTTCNDGRGKLIPKTFDYLTHFDSCLLHQFLHFSPVPLGYHTTVFGPSMSRQ